MKSPFRWNLRFGPFQFIKGASPMLILGICLGVLAVVGCCCCGPFVLS